MGLKAADAAEPVQADQSKAPSFLVRPSGPRTIIIACSSCKSESYTGSGGKSSREGNGQNTTFGRVLGAHTWICCTVPIITCYVDTCSSGTYCVEHMYQPRVLFRDRFMYLCRYRETSLSEFGVGQDR